MHYKKNEAADSEKVTIELSMGQIRFLDKMIDIALADIEEFGEDEFSKAKPLQKLTDVFFPILNIKMSEAEQLAHNEAWVKEFTKAEHEQFMGRNHD